MAGTSSKLEANSINNQATEANKIEISSLSKIYKGRGGDTIALQNTDLTIKNNEFVCVVGPSGCGKTTLLNIIGGLEAATSGSVRVDGKEVNGPGRERGVVFQQYALFPWKTVLKNVEFGLKLRGLNQKERKEKAESYLELVGLKDFAHAYPKELSGGMKQRVAIARAYAVEPEVLLMDEPFGALDAQTRAQLQEELLKTWQKQKKTCFFITHDVEEAVILAQRVIIMSARPGRIKEIIDVDIPYPRDQSTKLDERYISIKNEIWSKVYREYLEVSK
ncbi:ABC transporter ATP-binding protein [Paenibacillus sp. FSL H7-0331]|uniref:ABC transporter ATP-binding protein n=1 Tax=Paenibacillus sp. FSL H7-0331 TaxID=1920421 RepID=UPI00096EEFA4|nr:ABC transporter ATP-binding protein [Paenibacillus sp. FSL H7-0331]OMF16017.1 nitrate ABC transporter ATP-binding protein [Paenibacillus sp. FSL H7-0331]